VEITALHTKIEGLVEPLLEDLNLELVELHVSGSQRRKLVRLYVDGPNGVTVDQCAKLSREIGDIFDTFDPIDGAYTLEVSSPGLTRQLKTDRDFERVVGKELQLDVSGLGARVGKLVSVDPRCIVVEIKGAPVEIERLNIIKANLHFEI
jgi:ribosome maturation factor RimP